MSTSGIPIEVLLVMLIVVPCGIAVALGMKAFKHMPPLIFRCRRCGARFRRPAHKTYPVSCPRCHARDWNV